MSDPKKKRHSSGLRARSNSGENLPRNSPYQSRGKMSGSHGKPSFQRQGSYDHVRKIVQQEGRAARNLIAWNVPVVESENEPVKVKSPTQRRTSHHRTSSNSKSRSHGRETTPPVRKGSAADDGGSKSDSRPSSENSIGPKRGDLRARYWAFLFENLRRAVDEIYQTCETDESVVECKEVIMMLEQCTKDFKSLIERLILLKAYENAEEGQKPAFLAWEVRKSSPGKSLSSSQTLEKVTPSPAVSRSLNFSGSPGAGSQKPGGPVSASGDSWADKVKGVVPAKVAVIQAFVPPSTPKEVPSVPNVPNTCPSPSEEEDSEGWETVQRGGKTKSRNSPMQLQSHGKFQKSGKHQSRDSRQRRDRNSQNSRKSARSSQSMQNESQNQQVIVYDDASATHGTYHTDVSRPHRRRADSRDSEKENRPVSDSSDMNNGHNSDTARSSDPESKVETISSESVMHAGEEKVALVVSGNKKDEEETIKHTKDEFSLSLAERDKGKSDDNLSREGLTDDTGTADFEDELSLEESDKDTLQDDDEEALATQLEDALVSVMNEEDNLTTELEAEQEQALQSAMEEEQTWLKEIEREESQEIVVEEEPETESELGNTQTSDSLSTTWDWDSMVEDYDAKAAYREKTSWGDMVEEDTRTPGHGVHMHEKLSSPSRKRSPTETKKKHELKQAKAEELRKKLLAEKAERLRDLSKKVEEVHQWKEELLSQRRKTMEKKLQRAEEKRRFQLRQKIRKAHEEETKANEIAFINTLEAQNKRHDILSKHQESEARLQDLQEERQRKHEEKAAKEAAVEERRKALEAERMARLQEMQEKRKQRDAEIEQRQIEKEKERLETARAKEKDREDRIAALNAQQQAHIVELQKKIQLKQDESSRRHHEKLEQIREKAFEMSILKHSTEDHNDAPKLMPYDKKKVCTVCNVLIPSEVYLLSHLRGKKHQLAIKEHNGGKDLVKQEIEEFNLKHIIDAPVDKPDPQVASEKERQRALKKRCKKLRQRMAARGNEYEASLAGKLQVQDSQHRAKLQKVVKDWNKYLQNQGTGPWPQNRVSAMDRGLGEISRILEQKVLADQCCFRVCGGLSTLNRILLVIDQSSHDIPPVLPVKSLVHTCNVFRYACKGCYDNCHFILFSNKLGSLVDLLMYQLNMLIPDNFNTVLSSSASSLTVLSQLTMDPLASALMQLIATILSCLAKHNPSLISSEASLERMSSSGDAFMNRVNDIISYIISVSIVDKLTLYFSSVRGPVDGSPQVAEFLQHSLGLITAMTKLMSKRNANIFDKKKLDDPTQLISTFKVTDLVGIVSLMYGMLLHTGAPSRGEAAPPELPQHTLTVTLMGVRMLNHIATLDLNMLQSALGEEGTSLEFRHIISYLLWYCGHWTNEELLHEVILCIGYFTVLHHDNQLMIQSGQPPTVLQQLCSLPFQYFSDPRLTTVLFPTLIACCHDNQRNREILEQELSCALLANFIEAKVLEAQQAKLMSSSAKKTKTPEKDTDWRMALAARYPEERWTESQEYFKGK